MDRGITVSEKYGVNPTIPLYFVCNRPKNEIILMGRLPNDAEAPQRVCFDREPCDTCLEIMQQGIILISVRNGEEGDNPYRTGGWAAVTEAFLRRELKAGPELDQILTKRIAFLHDQSWDMLGLPRDAVPGVAKSIEELREQQAAKETKDGNV